VSTPTRPTVLLVDDDLALLDGLRRRLRRSFDVHLAADGETALAALPTLPGCSVIVADMLMPGMRGTELLARVRDRYPDVVRVLLTGYADVDAAIDAVNHAGTFRFLCKPCRASELRETLDAAVRQHELVVAERELLEQTLRGPIRALSEALALSHPKAFAHTVRRAEIVGLLVADLPEAEKWPIEVAAMLADVGVVTLPPDVVDKLYGGNPLTPHEQAMVDRLPMIATRVLGPIPRLERVLEILRYQDRRYDGADGAAGPVGDSLPLGARVLKIARDVEEIESSGGWSCVESLELIRRRTGAYDVALVEKLAGAREAEGRSRLMEADLAALDEVPFGSVLARDLVTDDGVLLAARGQPVTAGMRDRLGNWPARIPLREPMLLSVPVDTSVDALPA
jgi:response regulator RpfG family c-di-GMP phosphodiesterase